MIQAVGYRACYIFWTGTKAQMREEVRNEFGKYSGCWGSENVKEINEKGEIDDFSWFN